VVAVVSVSVVVSAVMAVAVAPEDCEASPRRNAVTTVLEKNFIFVKKLDHWVWSNRMTTRMI
jgi:hypothetical protein